MKRFWDKVNKTDSCWLWTGHIQGKGYGWFRLNGESRLAHRVSYEFVHGPIPKGMMVLHKCDNPPCVNPDHLYLGTAFNNSADRKERGSYDYKGSSNGRAKLAERQVLAIRMLHLFGATYKELAAQFNVHRNHISSIVTRRSWSHV